jgi:two-component system, sensor histidine kinase LadS
MKSRYSHSMIWILLAIISFSHSLCAHALAVDPLIPFRVNAESEDYGEITDYLYLLEEGNQELKADSLTGKLEAFSPYVGKELSKENAYWFAFLIQNNAEEPLEFVLDLGGFDFFEFYPVRNGQVEKPVRGGLLRPAWDLTFPEENRSSVPFELGQNETGTFLVRVENGEYFHYQPVFRLYAQKNFNLINNRETRNFWQGIFHGVLWVMIIYNIFFALIGRDRTYLYYALYMVAISLYFLNIFGYLTKYVYPDHPGIGTYVWLVMQTAAIFYIIFVRKFLDLKHVHRKWYRISKYLLVAVIIFVIFKAAYFLVFKGYGILSYLSQIVLILGVIFTAGLIFSLFRTDNRLARYFTIGSVSLGLGLLSASIIALTGDPYSKYFFYSIQVGIVFEIFFFSIGLSYKMRESEREKNRVQEELIHQLKENEKLQLNYQRELEQKVIERTREIEEQKEVLKTQKDRLQELE